MQTMNALDTSNVAGHAAPPPVQRQAVGDAALAVQMLDGFRVWHAGAPLAAPPHGRARTLFKVLLLNRQRPLSRARLCALLWPEADPASARNNLNVTLHRLRRSLADACTVHHDEGGYQLVAPGEVWLDTEQFSLHAEAGRREEAAGRRAQALAHYEAAVALYHTDLLHDDECETPLATEAQALRDQLSEVLERLSGLNEQQADWHGSLRSALRHLSLDPCNERAHQRLMMCYSRLGQLSLAERQYRACVSRLRRELGLGPSEETTALYRRIAARSLN